MTPEELNRLVLYIATTTQGGLDPERLSLPELLDYFNILQAEEEKAKEKQMHSQHARTHAMARANRQATPLG